MAIAAILLFLIAGVSGIYLGVTGAPYSALLMTVHKLAALLSSVAIGCVLVRVIRESGANGFIVCLLIVSAFLIAISFVSGALISSGSAREELLRTLHIAASAVIMLALTLTAVLVLCY